MGRREGEEVVVVAAAVKCASARRIHCDCA
jgi:hypothetical protein